MNAFIQTYNCNNLYKITANNAVAEHRLRTMNRPTLMQVYIIHTGYCFCLNIYEMLSSFV